MDGNQKIKKSVVVLLTDFSERSFYSGVMKGVILGINPEVAIVDLCHDVSRGDIRGASFILGTSFNYFPRGTVFICVVDPGVGGERDNLIVQTEDYFFVAPDNGVLTLICEKTRVEAVFSAKLGKYTGEARGATFLGRDILAPLAAHLSLGVNPAEMGEAVGSILTIPDKRPFINKDNNISGRAVYVDMFGNIITNISMEYLNDLFEGSIAREDCLIRVAGREMTGIKRYYDEGKKGELIALENSWGYLEIAVTGGSAFSYLGYMDKESIEIYLPYDRLKNPGVK
jgi:S-adenosylmethionine hydrolase